MEDFDEAEGNPRQAKQLKDSKQPLVITPEVFNPQNIGAFARMFIANGQGKALVQFQDQIDINDDGPQLLQVSLTSILPIFAHFLVFSAPLRRDNQTLCRLFC